MYIGVFLIICASVFMYRVAEYEKRRGWLWASLTAVTTVLLYQVMLSTYVPPIAAVIASFILMTLANIYKPVSKGPI